VTVKIIGIVNVTPDSFSDGGAFASEKEAISHARKLVQDGADIIDIGADSTRPGSKCVGSEEEWRRIKEIVMEVSTFAAVSVDTHQVEVADLAFSHGATLINNVNGKDPEMLRLVAERKKRVILMHALSAPHDFSHLEKKETHDSAEFSKIFASLKALGELALKAGIKRKDIILDPGMGLFISSDPNQSWQLVHSLHQFAALNFPFCLAVSRKGFLRASGSDKPQARDGVTALAGALAVLRWKGESPIHLRVHNVALQREWISRILSVP